MNTDEIQCILKRAELMTMRFLGVFPADKVPVPVLVPQGCDDDDDDKLCCCVANTDPDDRPGEHWVAFVWKGKVLYEYFDPYGMPLEMYPALNKTMTAMKKKNMQPTLAAVQPPLSTACGHFCIYFLYYRSRNLSLAGIVSRLLRVSVGFRDSVVRSFVRDLTSKLHVRRPCRSNVCKGSQCCKAPG